MSFIKRIFLFALVNMLILLTISIAFNVITNILGVDLGASASLWVFYSLLGMGGAFINLALSRKMAVWMMGVKLIDPNVTDANARRLVERVHQLARHAKLPAMPQVGIYEGAEINAFATGPTKARSLVAVSTGLLRQMDDDSIEGVLGHEVAHIANGDMVTMTLVQGVINTMVLIVARILSSAIAGSGENRSRNGMMEHLIFYALQIVLSLLGSIVVCYFSRTREFRADAGGARLAGRDKMLSGLKSLRRVYGQVEGSEQQAIATLKISGRSGSTLAALFSTHPPLEERIRRLESAQL